MTVEVLDDIEMHCGKFWWAVRAEPKILNWCWDPNDISSKIPQVCLLKIFLTFFLGIPSWIPPCISSDHPQDTSSGIPGGVLSWVFSSDFWVLSEILSVIAKDLSSQMSPEVYSEISPDVLCRIRPGFKSGTEPTVSSSRNSFRVSFPEIFFQIVHLRFHKNCSSEICSGLLLRFFL